MQNRPPTPHPMPYRGHADFPKSLSWLLWPVVRKWTSEISVPRGQAGCLNLFARNIHEWEFFFLGTCSSPGQVLAVCFLLHYNFNRTTVATQKHASDTFKPRAHELSGQALPSTLLCQVPSPPRARCANACSHWMMKALHPGIF